ncbi:MAG: leucine-rich repeat domain-containing protein, partial [Clostridiales Family XIII bacterium]|nr:leucine-rich repeat domain-containing protein [Clostridiales Family XIII bacterium]
FYRCKFEYLDFSLPSNIKTIGQYAFSLNNFTNYTLVVPPSLEEIEEGAFLESKLGGVDFSNASGLISIKENGFRGCHSLTGTLTLPENLTTIGEAAFMDTGYTGVDFSKAVKLTNVDDCIFGDGNKYSGQITQITFGSSIPADSFSADTFKGIPTGGVVFCPAGTSEAASSFVATYLTSQGITGWSVYTALDVDVNSIPESIVGEAIEEVNIISSVLGGTPPLVSCELVGGSLPLGLTFSPDGKVSGTPTEITPAGEITVKVTDSGSGNLNQSKSIVVPYGKVRALGSDATLVSYELGGVSGSTAEALGTPAATYNDVAISAGAVTLTSAQAKNANFIATPTDETATLEYAYTATDTEPSFGAWTPRTIANDSYVWVKVTAEDGNTLIYKIKVTVTGASQPVIPDHHIIFHSHDSAYGGKDGLTAFGEDVVVEFEGDFDTVQSFNFDDEDYNLSAYKDDKTPRTITEEDGNVIGSITQGSAVVTLYSSFADRLENGTYELQVWFDDSIVGDDATAGIAEIVVQRDGSVVPVDGGTKTGDEASLNLFLTIGGISLLMLIALIVYRRKVLA